MSQPPDQGRLPGKGDHIFSSFGPNFRRPGGARSESPCAYGRDTSIVQQGPQGQVACAPSALSLLCTPESSPAEAHRCAQAQERSFFVRMKSTLTKRGLHLKASGYKVGAGAHPIPRLLTPRTPNVRGTGPTPPRPSAGHPCDRPPPGTHAGPGGPRSRAATSTAG